MKVLSSTCTIPGNLKAGCATTADPTIANKDRRDPRNMDTPKNGNKAWIRMAEQCHPWACSMPTCAYAHMRT
jgi:hypothetical protein